MKISVVTATYNREKLLPKLYESLKQNYHSFQNFEWIIIDDGSKDNTKELVSNWINESNFIIKYFYQENSGKMSAINNAMQHVTGDITIEIDSDDYIVDDGLKMVSNDYEKLGDKNVYGIIYKRILGNKDTTVDPKMNKQVITLFDIHNKYGFDFDMNLTFKTNIRKQYSYELENSEKFVTEARLYYKLDQKYDGMLFRDNDLVVGEYMEDGYSKNIAKMFRKYPYGYLKYFNECLGYIKKDTLKNRKLYFIKHYILFNYLTNKKIFECIKNAKNYKLLVMLMVIPGYIKSKKFKMATENIQ